MHLSLSMQSFLSRSLSLLFLVFLLFVLGLPKIPYAQERVTDPSVAEKVDVTVPTILRDVTFLAEEMCRGFKISVPTATERIAGMVHINPQGARLSLSF